MTLPVDRWKRENYFLQEDKRIKPGEFRYSVHESNLGDEPTDRILWEYRDLAGTLHTGIEVSLPEAIKAAQRVDMNERNLRC